MAGRTEVTGACRGGENVRVAPADLSPLPIVASLALLLSPCRVFHVLSSLSVFLFLIFGTGHLLGLGCCFPPAWLPSCPLTLRADSTFS